jgi:hypothetical protein
MAGSAHMDGIAGQPPMAGRAAVRQGQPPMAGSAAGRQCTLQVQVTHSSQVGGQVTETFMTCTGKIN